MEADDQRWLDLLVTQGKAWPPPPWTLAKTTDAAVDLLSKQLQDANRMINILKGRDEAARLIIQDLQDQLAAERAKTAAITKAAAQTPQIPEPVAEESFPGRALRYSWGTK